MNPLAELHLRQARAFLSAGEPQRAVELMEKARALARDDQKMQAEILESLALAYQQTGATEKAARSLKQLDRLKAAGGNSVISFSQTPEDQLSGDAQSQHISGQSRLHWPTVPKIWPTAAVIILLMACAILGAWWKRSAPAPVAPKIVATTHLASPAAPASKSAHSTMNTIAIPNAQPRSTISSTPSIVDEKIRQCVGMLVLMGEYEGLADGNQLHVDIPLTSGTAFVIKRSGILLTTKQLTHQTKQNDFKSTLEYLKLPTVTLRDIRFIFCTGADPKDWSEAKLLYESDKFNLAILATARQFDSSLDCTGRDAVQGETLYSWGYPGAIALIDKYADQSRFTEMLQELHQTHSVNLLSTIRAQWFKVSQHSAEVAVPERNIDGTAYVQLNDSPVPGERGGPIVDKTGEVIAITSGASAMLINQLQDELAPYLAGD